MSDDQSQVLPSTEERVRLIVNLVQRDHVSFAECANNLPGFRDVPGLAMAHTKFDNVIMWANIHKEWVETLKVVLSSGAVVPVHTQVMVYMIDGYMLQMPVISKWPQSNPKEPHWLPCCLRPGAKVKAEQEQEAAKKGARKKAKPSAKAKR